jgi:S-DNA-T family DNA segregation ATPase FtsK/SpoIIIE
LLVAIGLFTAIGMLTPSQGVVAGPWIDFLGKVFGWGRFAVPLAMLTGGAWLLLRKFSQRLPRLEAERILGVLLLYLGLLVFLHALLGVSDYEAAKTEALQGRGGGIIGAVFLALMSRWLGNAGMVVALVAWVLVGITLSAGITLSELLAAAWRAVGWIRERLRSTRVRDEVKRPVEEPRLKAPEPEPKPVQRVPMERPPSAEDEGLPLGVPSTRVSEVSRWTLADLENILEKGSGSRADAEFDRQRGRLIEETLEAFGAPARVVEIDRGPTITRFGVEPAFIQGRGDRRMKVKVSKITALSDDLALALAARSVRIQAPVPGKGYLGIEVPNAEVSLVALRDVMESARFKKIDSNLRLGLGQDVSGRPIVADLAAMPHLLIAGTTGSGKSVCVNATLACLLLQNTPDDIKLVLVDPKRVELTFYNGIPHLLAPVVVELGKVVPALKWVSREMDERYRRFSKHGVRNIAEYNRRMNQIQGETLPYLIVVIDELADLMMMSAEETERVLTRLAQLARATGIHLVIATQRPSVDVVTGLIKANFPARIAFAVASSVDSRVILDQPGAEKLLGRGDMLFQAPDAAAPVRLQGSFVSEQELARLVRYWKNAAMGGDPTVPMIPKPPPSVSPEADLKQAPLWEDTEPEEEKLDQLYDRAVEVVRNMRRASISLLQRRLRIGYTRAARLVDQLEEKGIIGPAKGGSKPREVLDYGDLAETEGE